MLRLLVLSLGYGMFPVLPVAGQSLVHITGTGTDPLLPHIKKVVAECNNKVIIVVLSENVKCFSLSNDGSDFVVSPLNGFTVESTSANSCVFTTDLDTVWITVSDPMPPGTYSVTMQNGTDGNTLVDANSRQIPVGESVPFTITTPLPTPLDSLSPVICAPNSIQLVFSDLISCSSIAPDGSDFKILGFQGVGITKAEGECNQGFTQKIHLTLDAPLVKSGNYELILTTGTDGNTIVNECGAETPAGAAITFNTGGGVSAIFSYDIAYGCQSDTIALHYLPDGTNDWKWWVNSTFAGTSLSPTIIEHDFRPVQVQHVVSYANCHDTVTEIIKLDNILKAGFQAPARVCPKDLIQFASISIGDIKSWYWDFGDGTTSSLETPAAHMFPDTRTGETYNVSLVVQNNFGCYDSVSAPITKMQSCYINVPNGFTPNGDGINDYLYPLNAWNVTGLEFSVYNRIGQLVFETRDPARKWDGTINGKPQPPGSYVWTLSYTDGTSSKKIFLSGSSVLIR